MQRVTLTPNVLVPIRRLTATAGVLAIAVALAGCQMNRADHTGSLPLTYEERHPITVGYQPVDLIVHADPYAGGLSAEDQTAVARLARQYRNTGNGAIHLQAPSGGAYESAAHKGSAQIRQILRREGVDPSLLAVHTYRAQDGYETAPMKLVFYRYAANAGPCGEWPKNVAHNPENIEYQNHGCTSQRNLAAMVEDPRDLLGSRGHGPRDAERRVTAQEKYREGQDPSTVYSDEGARASEVGAQ